MKFKRIFLIVLDSLGIGEMPDAKNYGDVGSNTLQHIWEKCSGLNLPNLFSLGMSNFISPKPNTFLHKGAYFTCLEEASVGKDTMTGHWEMMGIHTTEPFITFTDTGFPEELLEKIREISKRGILGNKNASGTEILDELGEEQLKTGDLIVYTSADSVLQIAAHEEVIPLEELYSICKKVREITLKPEWKVGRIIARPYLGKKKGEFVRTPNRHDYAVEPPGETALTILQKENWETISVGKIFDIFAGAGLSESHPSKSNADAMQKVLELSQRDFQGLLFANLVDFDSLYGHRRDPKGYGKCLEEFDLDLGKLLPQIGENDLLMITADHGNDPTYKGTDHTREYVPLLLFSPALIGQGELMREKSFACVGNTILENFLDKEGRTSYYKVLR
ncbi:phosphopentomutase [Clostridia bacterium]|nr:phosphopentomutase [Clostridia bacterium]